MKYQSIMNGIERDIQRHLVKGKVANYIPALAKVASNKFAMAVVGVDGNVASVGDVDERFSVQSTSKLFTLTLAVKYSGSQLWRRVGREPSGNPFNSLVQLEHENGKPRNPFINAGAHVVTDSLISVLYDPKTELLEFIRKLSGSASIRYDIEVAESENQTGHHNRTLANFLKSYKNLDNAVDDVLDNYFHQCSIVMTVAELARSALFLANQGVCVHSGEQVLKKRQVKRINALMMTCGTYDACGEFAYRVGLPAKSGVGGGIVAVLPGQFCVAV